MKKISAILALTLILGLTGCKDDSYKSIRHPENDQEEEMVNPSNDSGNKVEETGETQNKEDMTNEVREEITDGVEIKVEDTVNMRLAPSVNSAVVGEVGPSDEILNLGETEGWTRVTVNGKTGYIRSDLLIKK